MKTSTTRNHFRPVAFFLIAIALILTIGFAAFGRQTSDNLGNNGNVDTNSDKADTDTLPQSKPIPTPPQDSQIYVPKYVNYLTGLECNESTSSSKPFVFLMNSTSPNYGISSADMIIELPTETDETRLLAYVTKDKLPTKIGSISPTRGYIDNLVKYFGGFLISNAKDDFIKYDSYDIKSSYLDLSTKPEYGYTEYTKYLYTNNELLNSAFSGSDTLTVTEQINIPYSFSEYGATPIKGASSGVNIVIPYSDSNETSFTYSEETKNYILSKNGQQKHDLLNDKKVGFKNVFLLFADATTYETAKNSEMVLDTVGGGVGIYFTEGTSIPFTWCTDSEGNMTFTTENGEKLTANRGTAYVGFMKSSRVLDVTVV